MSEQILTGKPSIDKPWLKYYPPILMDNLKVPECTLRQYLQFCMPSLDTVAMHYYGVNITWKEVFEQADICAKALKAVGFGEGDQIPVFLRSVPEFFFMLLAAETIGASLLCRDNTIQENVDAVAKSGAAVIFAHDFLSMSDMDAYMQGSMTRKVVLLDPCNLCGRSKMPPYIRKALDANYIDESADGPATMSWGDFQALGEGFTGNVAAPQDIDRPLFRCYTSGSTGPSKQVIHSAHSMIGVLAQMSFYGGAEVRPTWMVAAFPPSLVSVVISMLFLPLASNKLLILNPWVDPIDIDLELMRYKPNSFPMVPMMMNILINSKRIPADYDMSFLNTAGAGSEALNNTQLRACRKFLDDHNCHVPFTTAYGSSESGATIGFHLLPHVPTDNCNMGCPRPLSTVSIFKTGTTQEVTYNEIGEICVSGPGIMLGYDDPVATAKALKVHPDGKVWLHMGDSGYMTEEGCIYTVGRGVSKRYGGGYLDILPMENMLADANIPGIVDQFFVNIPDPVHEGFFVPYLYVVLEKGVTVENIRREVAASLKPHMVPAQIVQVPERPFWHFKTNRIGLTKEVLAERQAQAKRA